MSYLSDPIVLTFILLTATLGLMIMRPDRRKDLWLLIVIVAIFALPRAGFFLGNFNLPLPVSHILVAICITEWVLRGKRQMESSKINNAFLIYAIFVGLGLVIGLGAGGNVKTAVLEICFYLVTILFFFYISETFTAPKNINVFLKAIIGISLIISIYGIAQHYYGAGILVDHVTYNSSSDIPREYISSEMEYRRVLSSYGDPNVLANQLVFFFAIAFAIFIGKGIPTQIRVICLAAVSINALCIYYTGSRAGLICLAMVPFFTLCWRTRWAYFLIPFALISLIIFGPGLFDTIIAEKFGTITTKGDIRLLFPQMAWELLKTIPVGCGFGRAVDLSIQGISWSYIVGPTRTLWSGFNSFWLNIFSRLGVPGTLAFFMLIVFLFRYLWTQTKLIQNPMAKAFLYGGMAGLIAQNLIWLVNNTYILPGGGLNFWFMMGMLVATARTYAVQPYPVLNPYTSMWPQQQPVLT